MFPPKCIGWNEPRTDCKSFGGTYDLVIIDNVEVKNFIMFNARLHFGYPYDLWIGLNDMENEGTFRWVDGSSLNFTDWHIYHPSNIEVIKI